MVVRYGKVCALITEQLWIYDVDDDDNDFNIDHASQSSCYSKMGQESTDTDTGKVNLLDSDDKTSI